MAVCHDGALRGKDKDWHRGTKPLAAKAFRTVIRAIITAIIRTTLGTVIGTISDQQALAQ